MRVAVFSLTMNRLEYSKHCFKQLEDNAKYPYEHYIIDNGSTDGTVEWLKKTYPRRHYLNAENVGIGVASNQALEIIKSVADYDLIIKMDNDCEVVTKGILKDIVATYKALGKYSAKYILSPKVGGINNQPTRVSTEIVKTSDNDEIPIGITGMVGGLFMVVPSSVHDDFRYREDVKRIGLDSQICQYVRQNGGKTGYIENLLVNHYETTDAQALKYPEYFKKKWEEEKIDKFNL